MQLETAQAVMSLHRKQMADALTNNGREDKRPAIASENHGSGALTQSSRSRPLILVGLPAAARAAVLPSMSTKS
jgi:hypothetical protein